MKKGGERRACKKTKQQGGRERTNIDKDGMEEILKGEKEKGDDIRHKRESSSRLERNDLHGTLPPGSDDSQLAVSATLVARFLLVSKDLA